jgi:hypothetical protein
MEGINLKGKTLEDLRYIAKMMGIKNISKYKKSELIEVIYKSGNGVVEGLVSNVQDLGEEDKAGNSSIPRLAEKKETKSKDAKSKDKKSEAVDKQDSTDTSEAPVVLRKSKRGRPKANKTSELKSEEKAEKKVKEDKKVEENKAEEKKVADKKLEDKKAEDKKAEANKEATFSRFKFTCRIIARTLSSTANPNCEMGTKDKAGTKRINASAIPCPNPKITGCEKLYLSRLIKNCLNKKRKLSSKTPADNAIKIEISKGFKLYASIKSVEFCIC